MRIVCVEIGFVKSPARCFSKQMSSQNLMLVSYIQLCIDMYSKLMTYEQDRDFRRLFFNNQRILFFFNGFEGGTHTENTAQPSTKRFFQVEQDHFFRSKEFFKKNTQKIKYIFLLPLRPPPFLLSLSFLLSCFRFRAEKKLTVVEKHRITDIRERRLRTKRTFTLFFSEPKKEKNSNNAIRTQAAWLLSFLRLTMPPYRMRWTAAEQPARRPFRPPWN